jgi:hypothetical protein
MGKNYSCCNKDGKRKKLDFYETPYSITQQFLDEINKNDDICLDSKDLILEPCCGNGAIIKVLQNSYNNIMYYDIRKTNICSKPKDFLNESNMYDWIITNPPFFLAFEFIKKCKEVSRKGFCLLLPLNYLHGKKRFNELYNVNDNYKLKNLYIFTRYPMLGDEINSEGKYKSGMLVYAWYVWVNKYDGDPKVKWIDNSKWIINSKNK